LKPFAVLNPLLNRRPICSIRGCRLDPDTNNDTVTCVEPLASLEVVSVVGLLISAFGSFISRVIAKRAQRASDPFGRAIDRKELEEYAEMVAEAASQATAPEPPATLLDRLRDRSERREAMLETEIRSNLKVRNIYRWVFLGSVLLGLAPLLIGVYSVVAGALDAAVVWAAVGLLVEILALSSNQAAKSANQTAENRLAELRESQSVNDGYELALYAANLIEDPSTRADVLKDLALKQVGISPRNDPAMG
jgi:hypothetical protein